MKTDTIVLLLFMVVIAGLTFSMLAKDTQIAILKQEVDQLRFEPISWIQKPSSIVETPSLVCYNWIKNHNRPLTVCREK